MANTQAEKLRRIVIDRQNNILAINDKNERLDPLMMRLLIHFVDRPGQLISRQTLSNEVWERCHTSDEAITRGISRLRKLLGGKRDTFITTVPKQGYIFDIPETTSIEFTQHQKPPLTEKQHQIPPATNNNSTDLPPITSQQSTSALANQLTTTPANQVTAQISASQTTQPQQTTKTTNVVIFIVVVISTLLGVFWERTTKKFDAKINQQIKSLTFLTIPPIVTASNQAVNAHSIHNMLTTKLNKHPKLKAITYSEPHSKSDSGYQINIEMNQNQKHTDLELTIYNHNTQTEQGFNLNFDNQSNQTIADELSALIRIKTLNLRFTDKYMSAYNPLSYQEVEQLILAGKTIRLFNIETLNYAFEQVNHLNQKYPNNDMVLGLLATLNRSRANFGMGDVVKFKQLEITQAQKSLQLNPSNIDALIAANLYHFDFAHLRHKVPFYTKTIIDSYPYNARAWRQQLAWLIRNRASCEKIRTLITEIPNDVFTAYRTKVIQEILTHCIDQNPANGLLTQLSPLPNSKTNKAIIRNLWLFDIRDDENAPYTQPYSALQNVRSSVHALQYLLMQQNNLKALHRINSIKKINNDYWSWRDNLYMTIHPIAPTGNNTQLPNGIWKDDYYPYLENDAEWYYAATLVKKLTHSPQNKDNQQDILKYLTKRPVFPIEIMNRKENIAKIMMLYHAGEIEQSQIAANTFYHQLQDNFEQSPASFRFWNLGRYHLLTKLYCGQSCQHSDETPSQYFDKMFSANHIWWQDNFELMELSLQPWLGMDISQQFLQRIATDRLRMQNKLGFKVEAVN